VPDEDIRHISQSTTSTSIPPAQTHRRRPLPWHFLAERMPTREIRPGHLDKLDDLIEAWEVHRFAANVDSVADVFEAGDPTISREQPWVGRGPNPPRPGGVVRTPRTPDSTHQAYRSQGATSTFRLRI
jgi:hypothetical protein